MKKFGIFITLFSLLSLIQLSCVSNKPDQKSPKPLDSIPLDWISWDKNLSNDNSPFWWADSFDVPELTKAIRTAWKSNPELILQAEQTLASGEEAVILGADLSPQANLSLNGTRSKRNLIGFNLPNGDTSFTSDSFNAGLNLSWEIDLWGKLKKRKESAENRFELAKWDYEGARLSIAGKVARLWFEVIENSLQSELAEKTMISFEKNLEFITNRFNNGLASSLENDLAINAFASSQATFSMRERVRNKSIRNIELLLGELPGSFIEGNSTRKLPDISNIPSPPTPARILEERPDLQSSRLNLISAGYDLSISKLNLLPSINIVGGPGSRAENFEDLLDNRFRTWEVGGTLSQPIFQAGRLKAKVRQAEALKRAAIANYKSLALRAFNEVESLLFNENRLEVEAGYLMNASRAGASAAQKSWDRYQRGVQGIFETLESQRRAFEAKSRYLGICKERIHNRINLFISLGLPALHSES